MGNSYGTWYRDSVGILSQPAKVFQRARNEAAHRPFTSGLSGGLQLSRLVILATVVLLLTFSGIFKLTDPAGIHAFWPGMTLALVQLAVLAASYSFTSVRRRLGHLIALFCYVTVGLFVAITAANAFDSNYAAGLLFIVPGLGAGYTAATRATRSLAAFLFTACTGAAAACLMTAGLNASTFLFIASLVCISFVTLFGAAGWLDARMRYVASEERYRAVVEQASDGIFLIDAATFDLIDANPAFCQMVGASVPELRTIEIGQFLERTGGGGIAAEDFDRGRSCRVECLVRRRDGTRVFGELKVDRIRHKDGDVLSVVVHDITSRKEYEERLLKAKDAAEEIARFKSSLLANMSHEIRTPLSSILGWTAVLSSEVPACHRELVRLIEKSGKRLHNTLDSVIELAHLQANVKKLRPVRFDLSDAVRQTADLMRADADVKGLFLQLDLSDEAIWVESDPACLRRVLVHVLDNAIKFTERGGVTVSVRQAAPELAVVVEDTGVGISRDFLPMAFDEFKQESEGLRRAHEGSGLGLALVRRLMDLLGGRVDIVSEQGVGTVFTMYLPDAAPPYRS